MLPLDAFSRCWVQEGVLWQTVAPLLPEPQQEAFGRLQSAWREKKVQLWRESMAELARRLARAAQDTQRVESEGWRSSMKSIGGRLSKALGLRDDDADAPLEETPGRPSLAPPRRADAREQRAMAQLAERLDDDVKRSTDTLIRLHGLDGRAGNDVLTKLARHYATRNPINEGQAAIWGGVVTGALAGLKADIATGGLTLGGGLLAGGVIGALTAAGAARGVNMVRGVSQPEVRWDPKVLDALFASALLGYLAVAHHGRGRGAWVAQEPPAAWTAAVEAAIAQQRDQLDGLSRQSEAGSAEQTQALALGVVESACAAVLARLYPQANDVMRSTSAPL